MDRLNPSLGSSTIPPKYHVYKQTSLFRGFFYTKTHEERYLRVAIYGVHAVLF